MTTATASDFTVPAIGGRHHFLLRRLHSLTGIIFGGYLVVHLIVNATLIQGNKPSDYFQSHVDKIHSLPFLPVIEWIAIYLPILYHAIYGIWITLTGQWNLGKYRFGKNLFYVLQRVSALVLVLFIAFHILGMKGLLGSRLAFNPDQATVTVVQHMNASWVVAYLVYPIGILASAYHTANGFWTAAITWGLTTSAAGQARWGKACVGLGALLLLCGFIALYATIHDAGRLTELQNTMARR